MDKLNLKIKERYSQLDKNLSLDEKLLKLKEDFLKNEPFEEAKNFIVDVLNINQYDYYVKDVDKNLVNFIENEIYPQYEKNDQGHGILHIKEVVRRAFALNDTFKLGLDKNMIFAIAACHDNGKYIDHEKHHLIAAERFYNNDRFKEFFSEEEREVIKEAIEDHRSSKEDEPRSVYGKLISSADRNTTIEIVFIRSFYVALERMPKENLESYLDYTLNRLRKKYDEKNPENMFYEDKIYRQFLKDMRNLLSNPTQFKDKYCTINNIYDRNLTVEQAHQIQAHQIRENFSFANE